MSYQEFLFLCDSANYYLGHALEGRASQSETPAGCVATKKMDAQAPVLRSSLARLSTRLMLSQLGQLLKGQERMIYVRGQLAVDLDFTIVTSAS